MIDWLVALGGIVVALVVGAIGALLWAARRVDIKPY